MSRIPIVNPNRTYDNKEINLVSLLPNSMRETEVETFLKVFENFLNEMYEGATKYIPPEELDSILYIHEMIWTNNYQYVTAPYGNFLSFFKAGDFIRRNNETKYYKIEEVIDDSTIKLTEFYQQEIAPAYLKSAFWDEFTQSQFVNFWNPSQGPSPIGMDGNFQADYTVDTAENRAFCTVASADDCVIGTQIYGDFQFEFSFQRSQIPTYRNNRFGFSFSPTENPSLIYYCYYENGFLQLNVSGALTPISGYIEIDPNEDDWVINVSKIRDTGKIKFKVSSLKKKSTSVPVGFTSAVGFFNRFEYEIDVSAIGDVFDQHITLKIINGYQQAWNYFYFESDLGFPGEADNVDATSHIIELPENQYIYGTQFGRTFENDGGQDIFQFYKSSGKLRIRDLDIPLSFSATDFRKSLNLISILEKIHRLTELHDPDLIDIDFIQFFSRYLGYDVNINRETLGIFISKNEPNWNQLNDEQKQDLQDKYLRFIIVNLPNWYRIKTTNNAISIMLYSFGLITEINNYFCTNYGDLSTWVSHISGTSEINSGITPEHFQTPHFSVTVDIDSSVNDFATNPEKITAIIDAIQSVKPINTVFRALAAFFQRNLNIFVNAMAYYNQYVYLK